MSHDIRAIPLPLSFRMETYEEPISSYSEAKELPADRNRYLNSTCGICLDDFADNHQVTLLPCTHGFHSECFSRWKPATCPIDFVPQKVFDISLLGNSLSRLDGSKMNVYLYNHRHTINEKLQKYAHRYMSQHPEALERDLRQTWTQDVRSLFFIFQECSRLHKQPRLSPETIQGLVQQHLPIIVQILQKEGLVPIDCTTAHLMRILLNMWDYSFSRSENGLMLWYRAEHYGVHNQIEYLKFLAPELKKKFYRINFRFYNHHFKQIRNLPSIRAKYQYLEKMDPELMGDLEQMTTGKSASSILIRHKISQIKFYRKVAVVPPMVFLGVFAGSFSCGIIAILNRAGGPWLSLCSNAPAIALVIHKAILGGIRLSHWVR